MTTSPYTKPDGTPHLFSHTFLMWRLAGFWTLHGRPDDQTPRSYIVYSALVHLCTHCTFVGSMFVNMMQFMTIEVWTEDFPIWACTDVAIESILMYRRRHHMTELLALSNEMDTHVWRGDQRRLIAKQVRTSEQISYFLFASYAIMSTLIGIAALFSADRHLIFPAWFPIDWHDRRYLHIALVLHQLVAQYAMEVVVSTRDMFGPGMNKVLSSHLVVLGEQLEVCEYRATFRMILSEKRVRILTAILT